MMRVKDSMEIEGPHGEQMAMVAVPDHSCARALRSRSAGRTA
jgi:hypothetical protein